jgi:integrase
MPILKLTNASIRDACVPPPLSEVTVSGAPVVQRLYFDSDLKGFGVLVTRSIGERPPTKTFVVQRKLTGRAVRVKIGRFGDLSCDEARKRALVIIANVLKGKNPNREKKALRARGVSLVEAAAEYREKPARRTREKKAELTLDRHDYYGAVLVEWGDKALKDISRQDVLRMHKRLSKERGPVAANNVLKWFRSVYNAAMIIHEDLPQNPCVVLGDYWNKEYRRRDPITWCQIQRWFHAVNVQLRERNPIRADLHLFILFSGLRRTDACSIKSCEINLTERKIHRPAPNGGKSRAYDLPLSSALLEIIHRRMAENQHLIGSGCSWLFPTYDRCGRLTHVKEPKEKGLPTVHRLRDTFAEAAHESHIKELDEKLLMNHKLPEGRDVTNDYKRPSLDYLREQQEIVTQFLLTKINKPNVAGAGVPSLRIVQ